MQNAITFNCIIVSIIISCFLYINICLFGNINGSDYAYASSGKVIILTFDDDWKNQYLYVKPILDKYGFKATFFITPGCISYQNSSFCNNSDFPNSVMTWNDVKSLKEEGHDIESHGMSHKDLTALSDIELEYEIGQSKRDLIEHGINSTIFANAYASGENNSTVKKVISKYYDIARAGYGAYALLKSENDTTDKDENNTLTSSNRYSLNVSSHYPLDNTYKHNRSQILPEFIEWVNGQTEYNKNGEINAIPIIVYHNIDNLDNKDIDPRWLHSTTDVDVFDSEMKYLYDNSIMVLKMSDIGYNQSSDNLYIKNYNRDNVTTIKN
jgi:peptidoglycan/xylan/chitin deacetylase (PgdA/CDA1 family)